MSDDKAAETANAEANGLKRVLTLGEGEDAVTVEIPRKFKRLKFLRALRQGDTAGALDAIWPPTLITDDKGEPLMGPLGPLVTPHPEVARLEDADLDDEELERVMEALASVLGVQSAGNSSASPS
jgi:hypothetical protein